jgi:hypothetical protein
MASKSSSSSSDILSPVRNNPNTNNQNNPNVTNPNNNTSNNNNNNTNVILKDNNNNNSNNPNPNNPNPNANLLSVLNPAIQQKYQKLIELLSAQDPDEFVRFARFLECELSSEIKLFYHVTLFSFSSSFLSLLFGSCLLLVSSFLYSALLIFFLSPSFRLWKVSV